MMPPAVVGHGERAHHLQRLHTLLAESPGVEHGGAAGEVGEREEGLHRTPSVIGAASIGTVVEWAPGVDGVRRFGTPALEPPLIRSSGGWHPHWG